MFISPISGFNTTTYHQNVKKYPQNSYFYGVSFNGNQDYFDYKQNCTRKGRTWCKYTDYTLLG